jgi:hypothetical protein
MIRATPRDSLYPPKLLGIEILVKKHPPTTFFIGYPNVVILYYGFLASQDSENNFLECTQDIE